MTINYYKLCSNKILNIIHSPSIYGSLCINILLQIFHLQSNKCSVNVFRDVNTNHVDIYNRTYVSLSIYGKNNLQARACSHAALCPLCFFQYTLPPWTNHYHALRPRPSPPPQPNSAMPCVLHLRLITRHQICCVVCDRTHTHT